MRYWKISTTYTYDLRGNLIQKLYIKNNKQNVTGAYTYDETNKMVKGVNDIGESSEYLYNGLGALVENTWVIKKNAYGYHDVSALVEDGMVDGEIVVDKQTGKKDKKEKKSQEEVAASPELNKTSTVVKQFVVDYTTETYEPLMEYEVNGLDYRYVYGNDRLSVNITGVENGSAKLIENGNQIRLYYHMDYLGTADYLTSPVSLKVESWTHYNEWGEITHNAVLKCGQRELDLVKRYATHDFDAVLGLYYAKARFYAADNRCFTAMDLILNPSQYNLTEYITDPMQMVQYLYVKDNAITWIDPDGKMPVWMLRAISKLYNSGLASAQQVTLFTLLANGFNLNTGLHEIAQLNLAKYLYQKGYSSVELEYATGGKEADIATNKYIWEVKPITQISSSAPDKQLAGYLSSSGKSAGFVILRNGIPVIDDIYMGITTSVSHPGIEYYYFYRLNCQNQQVRVSSSVVLKEVKKDMLIVAGVVAVAAGATLVEDVFTLGAGTSDDLLSILAALGGAAKLVFA